MVDRGGRGSGGCHGYCGRWGSGAASVSEAECQRMPATYKYYAAGAESFGADAIVEFDRRDMS
jgi:hypothetical protein